MFLGPNGCDYSLKSKFISWFFFIYNGTVAPDLSQRLRRTTYPTTTTATGEVGAVKCESASLRARTPKNEGGEGGEKESTANLLVASAALYKETRVVVENVWLMFHYMFRLLL